MPGREYTMDQRAEALAIYVQKGVAEASRQTGVPKPTIASWARRGRVHTVAPVKTRAATEMLMAQTAELRERLRYKLLEKADDLLDRMDAEHVDFKGKDVEEVIYPIAPAAAVQNYATSVGILIDKYRLEIGEATGRTESWTNDHIDHERGIAEAIRQELAQRAGQRATKDAESSVVGSDSPTGADSTAG
jgi:hypothetical protein